MKQTKYYLLSFFFLFLLTSCSKNDPEPPEPPEPPEEPMLTEATMEGKHTLSFLLDDEVWVSDRGWGDLSSAVAISGKRLAVTARRTLENEDDIFGFNLYLKDFTENVYQINENHSNDFSISRSMAINNCSYDYENSKEDNFNIVDITWIDNDKRHIAGTFNLRLLDQTDGCTDTIYITDGRFDLQFQTTP